VTGNISVDGHGMPLLAVSPHRAAESCTTYPQLCYFRYTCGQRHGRFIDCSMRDLSTLTRVLNRIDDPSARKTVIMSKWQRGELTPCEAERLIRAGGLEAA
jgi:hypothetical protein